MLQNLIMTGVVPGVSRIAEPTDDQVKAWYQSVLDMKPVNLRDRVADILKKHALKPKFKNPKGSVREYVLALMNEL